MNIEKAKKDEAYIDFLIDAKEKGGNNVPDFIRVDKHSYRSRKQKVDFYLYQLSADYHYFVSRTLFLHNVVDYAKFSAYQCIENYLKALLKFGEINPPETHDLEELLNMSRKTGISDDEFIYSARIDLVISMFIPFYEVPRYPIGKTSPGYAYGTIVPNDIYVLDYFVYRMKKILPPKESDVFHPKLVLTQHQFPDFYKVFMQENANF